MPKQKQTKGNCQLCQKAFTGTGMSRHLAKCLADHDEAKTAVSKSQPKKVRLFQIFARHKYTADYWIIVEMPATATLRDLDQFLRDIWLECCGHLSEFEIKGDHYSVQTSEEAGDPWLAPPWEEHSMDVAIGDVLSSGSTFSYQYDFGSTTPLTLRVTGTREGRAPKKSVRLLARNDPPQILCDICKRNPAAWVNVFEDYTWSCNECIENTEEGVLPVVNSPRVGVCGYTGD